MAMATTFYQPSRQQLLLAQAWEAVDADGRKGLASRRELAEASSALVSAWIVGLDLFGEAWLAEAARVPLRLKAGLRFRGKKVVACG